jgi:hypothetical protein
MSTTDNSALPSLERRQRQSGLRVGHPQGPHGGKYLVAIPGSIKSDGL